MGEAIFINLITTLDYMMNAGTAQAAALGYGLPTESGLPPAGVGVLQAPVVTEGLRMMILAPARTLLSSK